MQHGNKELKAAIPVTQQQHHSDQVEYSHHSAGQVIGHVEDLTEQRETRNKVTQVETVCVDADRVAAE